jgi:hypothetical protein
LAKHRDYNNYRAENLSWCYRLISAAIILSMTEQPKFDYGDTVLVTGKKHGGRLGGVVAINGPESSRTYTIEFSDGSDSEIAEELLLRESADAYEGGL